MEKFKERKQISAFKEVRIQWRSYHVDTLLQYKFRLSVPALLFGEPVSPLGRAPVYQQTFWSAKIILLSFFLMGLGGGRTRQVADGGRGREVVSGN